LERFGEGEGEEGLGEVGGASVEVVLGEVEEEVGGMSVRLHRSSTTAPGAPPPAEPLVGERTPPAAGRCGEVVVD
jgi:hypothetical protein